MARLLLSDADDWHLKFPDDQDVRGYRVLDAQRNETGLTVRDMVIDTDAELVSHIVFSDGTEFPAADLSIGDGVVYATTEGADDARRTSDIADFGRVGRRSDADAFNDPLAAGSLMSDSPTNSGTGQTASASSYGSSDSGSMGSSASSGSTSMGAGAVAAGAMASAGGSMSGSHMQDDESAYRSHHQSVYGHTARSYDDYSAAYAYGRDARSQYGDRDFSDVESSLRGDYETRHGGLWDDVKDAVRHAYDRARGAVREATGPSDTPSRY